MIPDAYFPLASDTFELRMGIRPVPTGVPLLDLDPACYRVEVIGRRAQLSGSPGEYDLLPDATRAAQCEAAELLLADLAQHHANDFAQMRHGTRVSLRNKRLDEVIDLDLDPASSNTPPLLALAQHLQEDLCLLDAAKPVVPLVAGVVTFPGDWSIRDKVGLSFVAVHSPVPAFDPALSTPSLRLLEALRDGKPVWRPNWGGLKPTDQLDLSPKHGPKVHALLDGIHAGNIGTQMHFRVERQTLSLLPRTRHILFTIHTYHATLNEVAQNRTWAGHVLGWLRTAPEAWIAYKGMRSTRELLIQHLEQILDT